jgi:hypothetical protein
LREYHLPLVGGVVLVELFLVLHRRNVSDRAEQAVIVEPPDPLQGGETGTGKELVARAIHRAAGRFQERSGSFVAVDLEAADHSLAGSRLFGHRKGAFTDAVGERRGVFALAEEGGNRSRAAAVLDIDPKTVRGGPTNRANRPSLES